MNKFLTLLLVFLLIQKVRSQGRPNDFIVIEPPGFTCSNRLPFKNIEIVDSRFDITKVGYVLKKSTYEKLVVMPNLAYAIEKNLNNCLKANLDSSSNTTLLIVIKNLWLQGPVIEDGGSLKDQCESRLELYMKKDEAFYPIKRIDSVYSIKHSGIHNGATALMMPFQNCLEKVEKINIEKIQSSKKLSWTDIKEFNEQRFQKPVLKAELKKGIYLSFNDFLENRIDESPFEVTFGKLSDQLYIVDKNEKKLFTEFWGFCDGSKLYVNAQLNFYELVRFGNGFEFWGNEQVVKDNYNPRFRAANTTAGAVALGLFNYGIEKLRASEPLNKRPFQLNMENGTVY